MQTESAGKPGQNTNGYKRTFFFNRRPHNVNPQNSETEYTSIVWVAVVLVWDTEDTGIQIPSFRGVIVLAIGVAYPMAIDYAKEH